MPGSAVGIYASSRSLASVPVALFRFDASVMSSLQTVAGDILQTWNPVVGSVTPLTLYAASQSTASYTTAYGKAGVLCNTNAVLVGVGQSYVNKLVAVVFTFPAEATTSPTYIWDTVDPWNGPTDRISFVCSTSSILVMGAIDSFRFHNNTEATTGCRYIFLFALDDDPDAFRGRFMGGLAINPTPTLTRVPLATKPTTKTYNYTNNWYFNGRHVSPLVSRGMILHEVTMYDRASDSEMTTIWELLASKWA